MKQIESIHLWDTFNNVKISWHCTVLAAVRAQRKHLRAVKKSNGRNAYLPYAFRYIDGTTIPAEIIEAARIQLGN